MSIIYLISVFLAGLKQADRWAGVLGGGRACLVVCHGCRAGGLAGVGVWDRLATKTKQCKITISRQWVLATVQHPANRILTLSHFNRRNVLRGAQLIQLEEWAILDHR